VVARKIKKAARQSKKLRKEGRSGEVEERQMEELQKMRRQERLASQRLNERETWRERSPQEVGQEGEGTYVREEDTDMNLGEGREDSAPITGEIRNLPKRSSQWKQMRPPRSKKTTPKPVAPALNHPYPKCLLYKQ
jgi:hypothetical protein